MKKARQMVDSLNLVMRTTQKVVHKHVLHHTLGPHQKAQKNIKLISKGGKGMKLQKDNN